MIDFIENPKKVTQKEIELWEKENNIFLPDDYKIFLVNVGTGEFIEQENLGYLKKRAEIMIYDEINHKTSYKKILPYKTEFYAINSFFHLDELINENTAWGNYNPNKSSLLIIASLFNTEFYCICINRNSNNYGKIYYFKPGYHSPFYCFEEIPDSFDCLPLLEKNFTDFVENIEVVEN